MSRTVNLASRPPEAIQRPRDSVDSHPYPAEWPVNGHLWSRCSTRVIVRYAAAATLPGIESRR
jgi:hypothetical protein